MTFLLGTLLVPAWPGWPYLSGALSTWGRCIEGRRRWLWREWGDPLLRSEYYALGRYGRALNRAEWRLRWARDPHQARRALLMVLDAQRDYAIRRRQDLFPSARWRSHRSEYWGLDRYLSEVDRLRRDLRWSRDINPERARKVLGRAVEAEIRLLRARMEDIRRRNRSYWRDEEYRRLEKSVRDLEREARRLRR